MPDRLQRSPNSSRSCQEFSVFACRRNQYESDQWWLILGGWVVWLVSLAFGSKVSHIIIRIRLMCVLKVHIKLPIFRNIFLKIKKVLTIFSISEKMFPKLNGLMCALRAHISKILIIIIYIWIFIGVRSGLVT